MMGYTQDSCSYCVYPDKGGYPGRGPSRIADWRNGFIEADVISLDDPEGSWQ
jgi:hypothetical protein